MSPMAIAYHHMMCIQPTTHTHSITFTYCHQVHVASRLVWLLKQRLSTTSYSPLSVISHLIYPPATCSASPDQQDHIQSAINCPSRSPRESDGIRHSKASGHILIQGQATMVEQLLDNDFQQWCLSILTVHWLNLSQKRCL